MSMPENLPTMIKLSDLGLHIEQDTRVLMNIQYGNMQEPQKFYGSSASNLPDEIFHNLYITSITSELEYCADGIYPLLIINASDKVTMLAFDMNSIFQQFRNTPNDDDSEIVEE